MSTWSTWALACSIALFAAIPAGCGGELPPPREAPPAPRTARIAVVHLKRVGAETREGKRVQAKLDRLAKELRDAAAQKAARLLAAPADADPDSVKVHLDQWQASVTEYQTHLSSLDVEVEKRRGEWLAELLERARPAVAEVAEKRGYGLVLDADGAPWGAPEDDITDAVIRAFDAREQAGATLPAP